MKLSQVHPVFYYTRIYQKRMFRFTSNLLQYKKFARVKKEETFLYTCKKHQSILHRKLGDTSPQLQDNKVVNLGIAIQQLDGILIRPGELFSFWHLVGQTTKKKGYVEGLQLSRGGVKTGIGGGICQLANLLYWMALHTPLEVIERHHHSFDPFPDDKRVLPFGSGASVFYNYIDLRFYNPTEYTFQTHVWLTDKHLKGAIYSDKEIPVSYHITEKKHYFLKKNGKNYRKNEIWKTVIDKKTGNQVREEFLIKNFSEVKYPIPEELKNEGVST